MTETQIQTTAEAANPTPPEIQPQRAGEEPQPIALGSPPTPTPPPKETFLQGMARGATGETYVVDAQGNVTNARRTAPSGKGTFGNILMGVVMGALAGASASRPGGIPSSETGGGAGQGAAAARDYLQKRDERARGRAQQDFQNRNVAEEEKNKNLMYQAQIHIANLNEIKLAHEIGEAERNDPLVHQQLVNSMTTGQLEMENKVKDLGLINERTYNDYVDVPKADIDKFNRHEVKLITMPDGSVKVWDRTFDPRTTPNSTDFEVKDLVGLDPKTGKPEWKTVGHVKAGQGTAAQLEAEVDKERTQLADAAIKNATAAKEKAQTEEALAGAAEKWSVAKMNEFMTSGKADTLVDAAYNLQVDPIKITSMRTNARQMFMNRLLEKYPDFNEGAYKLAWDQKEEFIKGKIGQNLGNFSTAIEHLNQLSQIYDAFQGGNVQLMNKLIREAGYQLGDSPKASWNIVTAALSDELERAYTGVGATVEGAKQLRQGFELGLSKGNTKNAVSAAMATLKSRENSLRNQFTNAMPPWFTPEKKQPEAQGINLLSPQARQIMAQWGFGGAPKTGGPPTVIPPGVAKALGGVGPGRHTLSDGSTWDKAVDGSITQVPMTKVP